MPNEPAPGQLLLWSLRGHGRDVRCLREKTRAGFELRVLWGEETFLTERFADEASLLRRAGEFRSTLEGRGWRGLDAGELPLPAAEPTVVTAPPFVPGQASDVPAPMSVPDPVPAEVPNAPARAAGSAPVVLVVDDEPAIRRFLRSYLESAGYQVQDSEDVDSALSVLDEGGIDAVVLDVRMPDRMGWGRTGLEVLAFMRLHASYAQLPVLVLTGYPLNEEEKSLVERHRAYVFLKPDGHRMLLEQLNLLTGHLPGSLH